MTHFVLSEAYLQVQIILYNAFSCQNVHVPFSARKKKGMQVLPYGPIGSPLVQVPVCTEIDVRSLSPSCGAALYCTLNLRV